MRSVQWRCGDSCGNTDHWERFHWCRKCQAYLCHVCLYSEEHQHKLKSWVMVKDILKEAEGPLQVAI